MGSRWCSNISRIEVYPIYFAEYTIPFYCINALQPNFPLFCTVSKNLTCPHDRNGVTLTIYLIIDTRYLIIQHWPHNDCEGTFNPRSKLIYRKSCIIRKGRDTIRSSSNLCGNRYCKRASVGNLTGRRDEMLQNRQSQILFILRGS